MTIPTTTQYYPGTDEEISDKALEQEAARNYQMEQQRVRSIRHKMLMLDVHFTYTETKEHVEGIGICYMHRMVPKSDLVPVIVSSMCLETACNMALFQMGVFKRNHFVHKEEN